VMPKSNKLFELLELVKAHPHITIADVAKKIGVSERGGIQIHQDIEKCRDSIETSALNLR